MKLGTIPSATRSYLFVGFVVIPILINSMISFLLGYIAWHGLRRVDTWSMINGTFADLLATCFVLPVITSLIVTAVVKRQKRSGMVAPVELSMGPGSRTLLHSLILLLLSKQQFVRSLSFAYVIFVPTALSVWLVCLLFAPPECTPLQAIAIKTLFSALLGSIVTPLIAFLALLTRDDGDEKGDEKGDVGR